MNDFAFVPATKEQTYLRAAFFGPSGAGKTYTALRVATGMGGRIAVIDTEQRAARKYSDHFAFDVLDMQATDIKTYVFAIRAAAEYDVLIIDSLSHAWRSLLGEVDKIAQSKYRGNTHAAWSEGTPRQQYLIEELLKFPGHLIATMRSRTEWSMQETDRGRSKPVRIGLAPVQGKDIEYEFDLLMEISAEHVGTVSKDRTGKFQDEIVEMPGEDFGRELAAWLSDGEQQPAPITTPEPAPAAAPEPAPESEPATGVTPEAVAEVMGGELSNDISSNPALCEVFEILRTEQRELCEKWASAVLERPATPIEIRDRVHDVINEECSDKDGNLRDIAPSETRAYAGRVAVRMECDINELADEAKEQNEVADA